MLKKQDNYGKQNHWTERERATSGSDSNTTDRPRRSVLSLEPSPSWAVSETLTINMKRSILLTGFSCTGKTSLAKQAFGEPGIIDSDKAICSWIGKATQEQYGHIYEIFVGLGRQKAIGLIENAEEALSSDWAAESNPRIISLGPGFPLRRNWAVLRRVSHVVLFQRSAEGIYESLLERRKQIFADCPKARDYDNWDVGVIVDERRREYSRDDAVARIKRIISERERFYADCDEKLCTDDREAAVKALRQIKTNLDGNARRGL